MTFLQHEIYEMKRCVVVAIFFFALLLDASAQRFMVMVRRKRTKKFLRIESYALSLHLVRTMCARINLHELKLSLVACLTFSELSHQDASR